MEKAKRHTETSGEGVGSVFGDQPKLINGSGWSTALGDLDPLLTTFRIIWCLPFTPAPF